MFYRARSSSDVSNKRKDKSLMKFDGNVGREKSSRTEFRGGKGRALKKRIKLLVRWRIFLLIDTIRRIYKLF